MRHIEFFDIDHFENKYFRTKPPASIAHFIDFIWETDFEELAKEYSISARTLQRHFETITSTSSKTALQIMRIRKATNHLATSPSDFHYSLYGYYDQSHFYKHLKNFLQKKNLQNMQLHLKLLKGLNN